jgi:hypothetical protein
VFALVEALQPLLKILTLQELTDQVAGGGGDADARAATE